MNDVDLSYLAGFFDGEGCIQIWKKKDERTPIGYGISITVKITNTDKGILDFYNDLHNGRYKKKKKDNHHKQVWEIYYSSYNDVIFFLQKLLPFLKSKREVAELMIEYCQSRLTHYKSTYTKDELELYDKIKELIKRGE